MLRLALASMLLLSTSAEMGSSLTQCLAGIDSEVAEIGTPGSVEGRAELDAINSAATNLKGQAYRLKGESGSLDQARESLDRAIRYNDDRMRQLQFEQQVHNDARSVLNRRQQALVEESARQRAAAAAANTAAAAAASRAWRADGERRQAQLERDFQIWQQEEAQLQQKRQAILADTAMQAERLQRILPRSSALDRQFELALRQCGALSRRVFAFRQIAHVQRPSSVHYPEGVAAGVMVDRVLLAAGKETVVRATPRLRAFVARSPAGFKSLSKAAGWAGFAYTAIDALADATIGGMKEKDREVVRNIYLIGDYGYALKMIAAEQGPAGFRTPEYWAIRSELERLRAEMPLDRFKYDFALQSLGTYSALTAGIQSLAANYVGDKKAGKALAGLSVRSASERRTMGPAAMALFRGVLESQGSVFVPELVESAGNEVDSWTGENASDVPPAEAAYPPGTGMEDNRQ